jgi:hypothetical protein
LRVLKLEGDVANLTTIVQQHKEWLEKLDTKVADAAKRGDPVQVSGRTGWAPAAYVWTGKIL